MTVGSTLAFVLALSVSAAETALLPNQAALDHYKRILQLMDSTTAVVPGLARAAAPVVENARQAVESMRLAPAAQQDGTLHYDFLTNVRAYLTLADAVPKPHPFPQEGRRQFAELREATDRADAHFRALLGAKEVQLRGSDRDNIRRYAEANQRLSPPSASKPRVVFFGDSITDGWRLNEYFPDADFINRGISGQVTGQMLGRMQADVIALHPKAMVILAGTNDIARGVEAETIQNNLTMIADLAEKHGIKPVISSILPIHDYNKSQNPAYEVSKRRPPAAIVAMNRWIADFCRRRNFVHLDYFPALVDASGSLQKDLADDGLHPNAAGYRVMAPLAKAAIENALSPANAPAAPQKKKRLGLFGGQ